MSVYGFQSFIVEEEKKTLKMLREIFFSFHVCLVYETQRKNFFWTYSIVFLMVQFTKNEAVIKNVDKKTCMYTKSKKHNNNNEQEWRKKKKKKKDKDLFEHIWFQQANTCRFIYHLYHDKQNHIYLYFDFYRHIYIHNKKKPFTYSTGSSLLHVIGTNVHTYSICSRIRDFVQLYGCVYISFSLNIFFYFFFSLRVQ